MTTNKKLGNAQPSAVRGKRPSSKQLADERFSDARNTGTQGSRSKRIARVLSHILPTLIVVLLIGIAWEIHANNSSGTARIWSSPSRIVAAAHLNWDILMSNLGVTVSEGLWGFVLAIIIGITLGIVLYLSSVLNSAFMPLLTAAQTLPLISITPFFLWFFGFDQAGKIALVCVFSVFPIAIQTSRGLRAIPRYFVDVALTCGANRWWTLWHVQLRVAARQIFSGVRIAGTYIFATAATAEYMGSRHGIGIFLQSAYNTFQAPLVWAATIAIVVSTGIVMAIIVLTERIWLGNPADDNID
ncbi:ABC transporter permease [Alloscardovia venturai]|uniref:ABC transporter permease n=1 Tax=Alloscardovia venturai TaxID=1769421 RepID=A0ABW2Y592_9BIFI